MSEDLSRDVLLQEDLQPTAQLQKVKKTSRQSINPKSIVLENAPVQQHEAVRTNARPHSQDKRTKLRSDLKESHFTHALTNQSSGYVIFILMGLGVRLFPETLCSVHLV